MGGEGPKRRSGCMHGETNTLCVVYLGFEDARKCAIHLEVLPAFPRPSVAGKIPVGSQAPAVLSVV